jgi:hypothetical protein
VRLEAEREAKRRMVAELDPVGGPDFLCAACGSAQGTIVHTGTMRGATVSTTWQCDGCKTRVTKRSSLFYVVPLVFVFVFVLALFRVWLRRTQP